MRAAPRDLFIIAGEPSGDRLGADLMAGLTRQTGGAVRFHGLGGPLMAAEGLESLFPIDELSIMGLAEILPRVGALLRRIRQTARAVEAVRPAALITIDSPDFCLRVARRARRTRPGLRTIHYVAPSVWAWRPGRAVRMAQVIDHVLALLPFEPAYMTAAGMRCDFVGHPVAHMPVPGAGEIIAARRQLGLDSQDRLLCVLPGSRRGEVARHGPILVEALGRILQRHPGLRIVIPTVAARHDQVCSAFAAFDPIVTIPDAATKQAIFAGSDAALAVSGTVSLEVAAAGTPMVVAYTANALTAFLVRRMVRVSHASLVNILLDRPVIPEFLFSDCRPARIAAAVNELLEQTEAREAQTGAFEQAMTLMGRGQAPTGDVAARAVLSSIAAQA